MGDGPFLLTSHSQACALLKTEDDENEDENENEDEREDHLAFLISIINCRTHLSTYTIYLKSAFEILPSWTASEVHGERNVSLSSISHRICLRDASEERGERERLSSRSAM